jgi:ABC transporter substrate binding protein (PQQ-dependent alcohol dehydrogenase system)
VIRIKFIVNPLKLTIANKVTKKMRSCRTLLRYISFIIFACVFVNQLYAKSKHNIAIAYLSQTQKTRPPLSHLDPAATDKGIIGAELGIEDNNTTGEYTQQKFSLKKFIVPAEGNVVDTFKKELAKKFSFIITSLPPDTTNVIAGLAANDTLIFDAATIDDKSRNQDCRANVLHLLPSRAMRTDALAQYLMKKRWSKWFLVIGQTEEDKHYADALKRAAKRFGMKIVQEKVWEHTYDARRTAQADVATFTQTDDDYDVLVVADEQGLFGEYLEYRTWLPRPVAGTQGLTATSWHRTHEQWGAVQIQNRFKDKAGRWMDEQDYGAYLAARSIGEAATRTKASDLTKIKDYLLGDQFALQGYKGTALSFRSWDHQLRQPLLLAAPRSLVAVAPIEGFLHSKSELDTLGYDQPETACKWSN